MEKGEEAVLRSLEQQDAARRADNSGTLYGGDALSGSAPPPITRITAPAGRFARLVRKVILNQQQAELEAEERQQQQTTTAPTQSSTTSLPSPHPTRGHARTRSNVQVYNILKKLEQQPVFGPSNVVEPSTSLYGDVLPERNTASQFDMPEDEDESGEFVVDANVADIEQAPAADTTPLLMTRSHSAVRRFQKSRQAASLLCFRDIRAFLIGLLAHCWMVVFSALLALAALVLYYPLGNPKIDALGNAGLSWYCNFFARQIVLFEAARVLKYLLLDCLILGSTATHSVKFVGPFFTLLALQAKGWPFIVAVWGILDCCLLQGNNAFQNHWLYGTGWLIYSMKADSGLKLLASEQYLRLLVCFIAAGTITAVKRTVLAISFGRRQYSTFKPRLEKLLLDVVLLSEVAKLSAEADEVHAEMSERTPLGRKSKKQPEVSWALVKPESAETDDDLADQSGHNSPDRGGDRKYGRSTSSGSFLKSLLDRWEEPVATNKVSG